MNDDKLISSWHWGMNYCRMRSLPPSEEWAWDRAKKAYEEFCQRQTHPVPNEKGAGL